MGKLACLARCNGAQAEAVLQSTTTLEQFRRAPGIWQITEERPIACAASHELCYLNCAVAHVVQA